MKDPATTPYDQELAGIKRDLADLRANLLGKLSREIVTLQAQKNSLTDDIKRLQLQRNEVEVQLVTQQGLNQQEIQRQQWIEQLAQAIAVHLRANLNASESKASTEYSDTFDHLILNLDGTLRTTFQALQRDIDSYQQDLDRQMLRMHSQRQQGEMLLAALVEKLNTQLDRTSTQVPNGSYSAQTMGQSQTQSQTMPQANGYTNGNLAFDRDLQAFQPKTTIVKPIHPANQTEPSKTLKGFIYVMLASVVLSLQNVFFRIIFAKDLMIFGSFKFSGLIDIGISNSLMLLWIRMLLVTPFMWLIASRLRSGLLEKDVQQLLNPKKRGLLARVAVSAMLLFVSFVSIIISLSLIKPALVTTLFFVFPTITVLLAWFLYGDRPSWQCWLDIAVIYLGIILTINLFGRVTAQPDIGGTIAAITSGVTFACYVIVSGACFKEINPVSFTAINFTLIFALACLTIPFFAPSLLLMTPSLFFMCILIALTTIGGYLFTNFGIQLLGAAQSSLISAIGPVLTTLLAFSIVGDRLDISQLVGVFLVMLGVGWLNLQNIRKSPQGKSFDGKQLT